MNLATTFDFVTVFFAGLLAGIEFVIHYGVRGPSERLDDRARLQFRQLLALRLRVMVPVFFVPTAILGIAITLLNGTAPGLWFRVAALLSVLIWALIRVVGTVPINSATVDWDLDAPPKDWKEQVTHAERFHIVGVWAAVLAFACFLTALALQLAVH
jgi:hypothetical protein